MEPPAGLEPATYEVLAACGISPALFDSKAAAAAREAWRQTLFGVIAPLGRIVADELTRKLETEVTLTWDELRASDLPGGIERFKAWWAAEWTPRRRRPWRPDGFGGTMSTRLCECGQPTVMPYHDHCVVCIRTAPPASKTA